MPSATDHPNANGSVIQWTAVGSSAVGAVGGNDGDSSYIYASFGNKFNKYGMPDLPGTASAVSSVGEYAYRKYASLVGSMDFGVGYNKATAFTSAGVGSSYSLTSASWNSYLTVSDVNSGESGVQGYDTAGGEVRCTELYRTVNYTEGGSQFVMFWSWVGPMLFGASITLRDLLRAGEYCKTITRKVGKGYKSGTRKIEYTFDEIVGVYNDMKGYRYPSFFQIGEV